MRFEYDDQGRLIVLDENGKKTGEIWTIGNEIIEGMRNRDESGMMGSKIKARYISDEPSDFFQKGEAYDGLFYPVDDSRRLLICYEDNEGEEYAISADHFEILEESATE